jgi:hypothetical protein
MNKKDYEREIEVLKSELDSARRTIIDLMPKEIADRLERYCDCETHNELDRWLSEITEFAIDKAEIVEPGFGHVLPRALCPLCKSVGHSPYVKGYELPNGLSMHLEGRLSARPRKVIENVRALAIDHIRLLEKHPEWKKAIAPKTPPPSAEVISIEARAKQFAALQPFQVRALRAVAEQSPTLAESDNFTLDVLGGMKFLNRRKGVKGNAAWEITDKGREALERHS